MRTLTLVLLAGCAFEGKGIAPADSGMASRCSDGIVNGGETGVDCGGDCAPCVVGPQCSDACAEAVCELGVCRPAAQCDELHQLRPDLGDGSYTIDPDGPGPALPFATYCDMTVDGGGWTLVGKVDGEHAMSATWLVSAVDVAALVTPTIVAASYACIDAVDLAVNHSTEIRFTNSTRTAWAKWPLPDGRTLETWWQHSVGWTTVNAAPRLAVTVTTAAELTGACFQNVYGIMPFSGHGGAYPFTSYNEPGNTAGNDFCMAVGTTLFQTDVDGFAQNGNGYDAPTDEATWPNPAYHIPSHIAVWLR